MRHGGKQGWRKALPAVLLVVMAAMLCLATSLDEAPHGAQRQPATEETVGGAPQSEGLDSVKPSEGIRIPSEVNDLAASGWTSRTCEEGGLEQVATRLLERYRDANDCVLAQAGYLDLMGSVWGCVVFGGTWADVVVVSEEDGGQSSTVCVLRMEADELAALLQEDGEG